MGADVELVTMDIGNISYYFFISYVSHVNIVPSPYRAVITKI